MFSTATAPLVKTPPPSVLESAEANQTGHWGSRWVVTMSSRTCLPL